MPRVGSVVAGDEVWEPWRLLDPCGEAVTPVAAFLRDLQACGRAAATQRSYCSALLRWFRFLWAIDVEWDRATTVEARDFSVWIRLVDKASGAVDGVDSAEGSPDGPGRGRVNPVTGKVSPGRTYGVSTRAHQETVVRGFYDFHLDAGTGPMVNPFPLARISRREGRRGGDGRSPIGSAGRERAGWYRPRVPSRVPRSIPDERFDELFARLGSHRDRALVALWVSTGARASELLGLTQGDVDPGQQLVTVVRKGSRAIQQLPASSDAFVWLRLYQAQMHGLVPAGRDQPQWWTLRRPFRPLTYHAAHRMFTRVSASLGADWTLHDLRHTAAYRMARDPKVPITDVQWVMGHSLLTTTQIYVNPLPEDVITAVLAHHARERDPQGTTVPPSPRPVAGSDYRRESLDVLFGQDPR